MYMHQKRKKNCYRSTEEQLVYLRCRKTEMEGEKAEKFMNKTGEMQIAFKTDVYAPEKKKKTGIALLKNSWYT